MTIHQTPRDVLSNAFKPKLAKAMPPVRFGEDDSLIIEIRDKIARAQNIPHLRQALASLLGDSLHEMKLEEIGRNHPGLIGTLTSETA